MKRKQFPADAADRELGRRGHRTHWQPYLRLARLDRPIGTWLLFWPCVFGLALGRRRAAARRILTTIHDGFLLILFGIGAVVMRGAGCTYNDIVDRDIDAQVARTRGRPHSFRRVERRAGLALRSHRSAWWAWRSCSA